jgi:two-component system, response regulator RegA
MKILIADDDRDQLALRCMLLSHSGFETIGVADADSAIDLATEHKPECALLDLRLPTEELGLRLVRDLKKLHPSMHLFVLTGADARWLAKAPETRLIDGIVTKGSSSAALIQRLNELAASLRIARS